MDNPSSPINRINTVGNKMVYKLTSPGWLDNKKKYVLTDDSYDTIEELITAIFESRDSMRQGYDIVLTGELETGYVMTATPKPTSKIGKSLSEDA